jgi:hypothetical protein
LLEWTVEQAATIVLSTPVAAIAETSLLPSPPLDVEIPNEGFQTGDLYEDIQVLPPSKCVLQKLNLENLVDII